MNKPKDPDCKLFLHWFCDLYDRGFAAAKETGAEQSMDGSWPVAILPCASKEEADEKWKHLFDTYGVNAMNYEIVDGHAKFKDPKK